MKPFHGLRFELLRSLYNVGVELCLKFCHILECTYDRICTVAQSGIVMETTLISFEILKGDLNVQLERKVLSGMSWGVMLP